MMKSRTNILLSLLLIATACNSTNDPPATYRGDLKGRVKIYSNWNASLPSEGITVVLDDGSDSTLTDTDGYWSLSGVPIGTHEITASKDGFGKTSLFNIQVTPGGLTWVPSAAMNQNQPYLCAIPTGNIEVDSLRIDTFAQENWADQFSCYFSFDTLTGYSEFLDTSADVQPADVHLIMWQSLGHVKSNWMTWHRFSDLWGLGLKPGTTLYYSVCKCNGGDNQEGASLYYDPVHNQYRVATPGPKSNVVKLSMR
ncbi:MAG: carboxypeptidase-like regulatory domain-containing protein [Bacteroidota bacterium]|nr:carboxypeptidase-like regulatory domain-containing protein [Bacteroidota bacterium]MDP4232083.1 carboxypeptidase-like regulatory domain-containing protein [Bacteroidota bacterium]MDP4241210.1 carboxypeptidase-like regulatory domain-containing protein [Bacteroidota bacterium]MDP4286602.1 carboxypeptidase-like regulatory domain-containing protein [Bacteroidota bacterium]